MAKTMARIVDGIVSNIESWDDNAPDTEELKGVSDRSVCIGDTYVDGVFYHNEEPVFTSLERAYEQLANAFTRDDLNASYQEGVNSV